MPIAFLLEVVLDSSSCVFQLSVEIAHPDHDQFVVASRCKVVSFLVEFHCSDVALVAEDGPSEPALLQIPDFYFVVGGD